MVVSLGADFGRRMASAASGIATGGGWGGTHVSSSHHPPDSLTNCLVHSDSSLQHLSENGVPGGGHFGPPRATHLEKRRRK
ncbi:hypothetical protein V6N13_115920 [Hibiscus sabdariffa]|uniref:Uncharacterized protein n=1 Tax=Hibiscus sabdariffa TaxID=183260 RepID=A0ABR2QSA8_9ROSI